jgi:hypothetical protein
MAPESKRSYKIYRPGGKIFRVYREYDQQMDKSYPAYSDLETRPECTDDGRPFATAEQENCLTPYPALRTTPCLAAAAVAAGFTGSRRHTTLVACIGAMSGVASTPKKKDNT